MGNSDNRKQFGAGASTDVGPGLDCQAGNSEHGLVASKIENHKNNALGNEPQPTQKGLSQTISMGKSVHSLPQERRKTNIVRRAIADKSMCQDSKREDIETQEAWALFNGSVPGKDGFQCCDLQSYSSGAYQCCVSKLLSFHCCASTLRATAGVGLFGHELYGRVLVATSSRSVGVWMLELLEDKNCMHAHSRLSRGIRLSCEGGVEIIGVKLYDGYDDDVRYPFLAQENNLIRLSAVSSGRLMVDLDCKLTAK